MAELLSFEEGEFLVRLARNAVEAFINSGIRIRPPQNTPPSLFEKRGVFVTINTFPSEALRGCIGFPEPILPIVEATIDAALSAAFKDPRFPPLSPYELGSVVFEVTALTKPQPIVAPPEKLPEHIKVGRDGLIVRCGLAGGLLLPQVPVEWGWDEREFLSQTCIKAGLPPECWKDPECQFFKFQGQIFKEKSPSGAVAEVTLS